VNSASIHLISDMRVGLTRGMYTNLHNGMSKRDSSFRVRRINSMHLTELTFYFKCNSSSFIPSSEFSTLSSNSSAFGRDWKITGSPMGNSGFSKPCAKICPDVAVVTSTTVIAQSAFYTQEGTFIKIIDPFI
jgi:hypothetical protein